MSIQVYKNGVIAKVWDENTRTVTDYTQDPPATRPYTPEENAAADARISQAVMLTDLQARLERIEAALWPAPPDPEDPEDPSIPEWNDWSGVWPANALLRDGGKVWRNVTSVPLTTPPSGFPGQPEQWDHLFVEIVISTPPDPEPEWPLWVQPQPGVTDSYAKDAKVTHKDQRWTSDLDGNVWEPGVYGWTLAP